jgi:hypothetical protein
MTEIFDNIRGIYDFSLPCEPLRPFIEFFSGSSPDRTALSRYLAARTNFSPEEFGYFDQSHFYKAICQFTGRRLAGRSAVDHPSIDRP